MYYVISIIICKVSTYTSFCAQIKQWARDIKTYSSELRGQEGTKCTPNQKNATTTVSHLHDKMVHHILKSAWQNLRLMKGFTLHITGIKPLCWYYAPHEVSELFVQLFVD